MLKVYSVIGFSDGYVISPMKGEGEGSTTPPLITPMKRERGGSTTGRICDIPHG